MLASAFFRTGYIESWGRGIEKILRECQKHGIPIPVFDSSLSGLMLTFRSESTPLVLHAEEEPQVYVARPVAEGIKYHLNKLRAEGVVRHVGPTKSGRWEVLK